MGYRLECPRQGTRVVSMCKLDEYKDKDDDLQQQFASSLFESISSRVIAQLDRPLTPVCNLTLAVITLGPCSLGIGILGVEVGSIAKDRQSRSCT